MEISTKNYLLQSVSQVLSECHRIVSVLSNVMDEKCQECQCQDLWWDNKDINHGENYPEYWKELYEKTSEALDISLVENEDLRTTIREFILTMKNENNVDKDDEENTNDDDVCAADFSQITAECSRICSSLGDFPAVPKKECSVSYKQECNTRYEDKCHPVTDEKSPTNDDPFQSKLLVFMSKSCPDGRYDVNWREEILRQILPSDFFSIWTNYDLLTSDLKDANVDIIIPTPIIRYPTIDIAKCNTRSLANVPKPQKFPLFGCSDDPNFYIKSRNMYQPEGEFYKNIYPFGAKYGYLTNQGVVPVPEEPVFGYVWDGTDEESRWVLCAVHPPDHRSKVARKWKGLREKG